MTNEEAKAYFKRHIDLYCVDGIFREAEEMAIQALEQTDIEQKAQEYEKAFMDGFESCSDLFTRNKEQQPCDDAISRQAVLDVIKTAWTIDDLDNLTNAMLTDMIKTLQPVTPQQKYGKWIENAPEYQNIDPPYICSECGNMHLRKTNYCDQCGCRMYEPQESEDKE